MNIPFIKSKLALKSFGHCPTCDQETTFEARNSCLRANFICKKCKSIPRERALMLVIETMYPNWRDLTIHETSPGNRGASRRLSEKASNYIPSQFFPDKPLGGTSNGLRCENLEHLTFANESIDLHISQDVMEHVFHPSKAFREIARTLKPGGAHIFTVPLVNKQKPSKLRACITSNEEVAHIEKPVYHGNPISDKGSLVTIDWGFDICQNIFKYCGLFTYIFHIDDLSKGVRAEYIEVLVTVKPNNHDMPPPLP